MVDNTIGNRPAHLNELPSDADAQIFTNPTTVSGHSSLLARAGAPRVGGDAGQVGGGLGVNGGEVAAGGWRGGGEGDWRARMPQPSHGDVREEVADDAVCAGAGSSAAVARFSCIRLLHYCW